jgi:hypothetical protein
MLVSVAPWQLSPSVEPWRLVVLFPGASPGSSLVPSAKSPVLRPVLLLVRPATSTSDLPATTSSRKDRCPPPCPYSAMLATSRSHPSLRQPLQLYGDIGLFDTIFNVLAGHRRHFETDYTTPLPGHDAGGACLLDMRAAALTRSPALTTMQTGTNIGLHRRKLFPQRPHLRQASPSLRRYLWGDANDVFISR